MLSLMNALELTVVAPAELQWAWVRAKATMAPNNRCMVAGRSRRLSLKECSWETRPSATTFPFVISHLQLACFTSVFDDYTAVSSNERRGQAKPVKPVRKLGGHLDATSRSRLNLLLVYIGHVLLPLLLLLLLLALPRRRQLRLQLAAQLVQVQAERSGRCSAG